jgi:hypothetical protein
MSEQDRPVELPIPDEVACVGGVSQAIYTANSVRAAIRADRAAAPQPQPAQAPDLNLSCKSVQARLAAQWGYAPAQVLEALREIGKYTGEGPYTTPWQDIVRDCGEIARAAIAAAEAAQAGHNVGIEPPRSGRLE